MPENGQNLTSSEIYTEGTHITEKVVPVTKFRRLFDQGPHMAELIRKRSEDTLDYTLELWKWLEPGEKITRCRAWSQPNDLIIPRLEFSDTAVVLWAAGGNNNVRHEVRLRVSTSLGKTKLFRFMFITNGIAPNFVFVSVTTLGVNVGVKAGEPEPLPVGPVPTATPGTFTFGEVYLGENGTTQISVKNTGDENLSLRGLTVSGDFTFTSEPLFTIRPGKSFPVVITFTPSVAGARTGVLSADFGDGPVALATLTGTGVASTAVAKFLPTSLAFAATSVGEESVTRSVRLTNTGRLLMTISSITATGDFVLVNETLPTELAPNAYVDLSLKFVPSVAGTRTGAIVLVSNAAGPGSVPLSGTSSSIVISIGNAVIEDVSDEAVSSLTPLTLAFGNVQNGEVSTAKTVTLGNTGGVPMAISSISASGQFSQSNDCGTSLAPGETCTISVTFRPTSTGAKTGSLSVVTDAASGNSSVALAGTGTAVPVVGLQRLSVSGTQFVTPDGTPVRLKSVNWFGAEGTNHTPHGTWIRPWKDIIDQIAGWGFNCIRMPFSGDFTTPGRTPPTTAISALENPDLVGKTALQILDMYVAYCKQKGIYIVLDHHRRTAGAGADGSPIDGSYTLQNWIDSWLVLANRYKDEPTVVGADVHNEPHDLTWDTWAGYVEQCGNAIHTVAPDWIIFVEGVGIYDNDSYWWGGQLKGVATRPVVLTLDNRVAYSPHEYGQSVGSQQWLAYDNQTPPANWPNNLWAIWKSHWGFIFENGIAPIWVGEFGGFFGVDGSGNPTKPHGTYEKQWAQNLAIYLNGDFTGDGTSNLPAGTKGMSFAYWSYNPVSGDTGGLVQDDWITPQTVKLNLINPLLAN